MKIKVIETNGKYTLEFEKHKSTNFIDLTSDQLQELRDKIECQQKCNSRKLQKERVDK